MACEAWCVRLQMTLTGSCLHNSHLNCKGWSAINTPLIICTDWECSQSEINHSLSLTVLFLICKIVVTAYCTCSSETDMCRAENLKCFTDCLSLISTVHHLSPFPLMHWTFIEHSKKQLTTANLNNKSIRTVSGTHVLHFRYCCIKSVRVNFWICMNIST